MKTLNKIVNVDDRSRGNINEIVSHGEFKFKLVATLENGRNLLNVNIMAANGTFINVLDKNDVSFKFTQSYVSDASAKQSDLNKGLSALKALIKKVY